jgi:hypothetical protein
MLVLPIRLFEFQTYFPRQRGFMVFAAQLLASRPLSSRFYALDCFRAPLRMTRVRATKP